MSAGDIVAPKRLSTRQQTILSFLDAHDNTPAGVIIVTGHRTTECYLGTMTVDSIRVPVPVVQTNTITEYKLRTCGWIQRIVGSNKYRISRAGLAMLHPVRS